MSDLDPRSSVHPPEPICINSFSPAAGDVLRVGKTRRGFLQTGLAGLAGLSLPALLQRHALAVAAGQVIGSTDAKGYDIESRRVGPSDLAATVFRHLGIDQKAEWLSPQGRPVPIVTEGGRAIEELW